MADALDEHLYKDDIAESFGDIEGGIVRLHIDKWWQQYVRYANYDLRAAYVVRHIARFLIRRLSLKAVNFSSKSRRIDLQQQIENLQVVVAQANADIKQIGAGRSPADGYRYGRLTTTAPFMPSDDPYTQAYPDAHGAAYRGSAYHPRVVEP